MTTGEERAKLLYGFRHGSRFDRNLSELQDLLASPFVEVVQVSTVTSDR